MAPMMVAVLSARGTGRLAIAEVRQHPDREHLASAYAIGVSEPMITWARRIVRLGVPELIVAVEDGRIALYMAARVANLPEAEQRAFLQRQAAESGATLTARCSNVLANRAPPHA
jgi:predicted RNA methylase